jgi:hypothetical protein
VGVANGRADEVGEATAGGWLEGAGKRTLQAKTDAAVSRTSPSRTIDAIGEERLLR